jgi:hypothetical protein
MRVHNKLKQDVAVILVNESKREYSLTIGAKKYEDVPAECLTKDVYHKAERGILKLRIRPTSRIGSGGKIGTAPVVAETVIT